MLFIIRYRYYYIIIIYIYSIIIIINIIDRHSARIDILLLQHSSETQDSTTIQLVITILITHRFWCNHFMITQKNESKE